MKLLKNEDGMSTIEVIFLIAVLISLAIMFGSGMKKFVTARLTNLTDENTFDKVNPANIDGRIKIEGDRTICINSSEIFQIDFKSKSVSVVFKEA